MAKDIITRWKADTREYDANLAKAKKQLEGFKKDNLSASGALKQLSGSLVGAASSFLSVTAAVGALGGAIMSNIETARKFEKSMSQLSSLTGMVGRDLNQLKEYAIELGASTTLSASQVADAFRLIGSQQPQLLASGEALKEVTKQAITLSEAAGIDLETAAQTLSTSINQMGGDSDNAARYVNVLAAASQKGAGDIAWLGTAITNSGTAAKAVGTDYEELVANLEQLAQGGFDASTAGTALRSIIMNLEKQANSEFKPSIVGLTTAFENLGKANLSIVEYQKIAGKMFASQAKVLADASSAAREMTEAITGTNTAEEQAKTNTDNLDGSLKSLSSAWEGLNLHINSSNGLLKTGVDLLTDYVRLVDKFVQKMSAFKKPITSTIDDILAQENAVGNFTIYNPEPQATPNAGGGGGGGKTKKTKTTKTTTKPTYAQGTVGWQEEQVQKLQKAWKAAADDDSRRKIKKEIEDAQWALDLMTGKTSGFLDMNYGAGDLAGSKFNTAVKETFGTKYYGDERIGAVTLDEKALKGLEKAILEANKPKEVSLSKELGSLAGGMDNIIGGIETLGIEVPQELKSIISGINAVASILSGINTIMIAIKALSTANLFKFAGGGVVHAAGGYTVPGNYGYDAVPALLSSQEVVLNRAQAGNLASQLLEGERRGGGPQLARVSGEQIYIAMNNYLRRSGKGELVTWR